MQKVLLVGYVGVSAADRNEARQLEAPGPVGRLIFEKFGGKNTGDIQRLGPNFLQRSGPVVFCCGCRRCLTGAKASCSRAGVSKLHRPEYVLCACRGQNSFEPRVACFHAIGHASGKNGVALL